MEWVQITLNRRIGYDIGSTLLLLVAFAIVWLILQVGRVGMIDAGILGGCLAGGGFMAYSAITGKEQRKIKSS